VATLFIPTRNRPTALGGVLGYLARFYPGARILLADGSAEAYRERNEACIAEFRVGLQLEHLQYPEEMGFFDRMTDALRQSSEPYFIMGADDDFPFLEAFEKGAAHMDRHPECAVAIGGCIRLNLSEPGRLRAVFRPVRPFPTASITERLDAFSRWPFPTTYALTRRDVLLKRFERGERSAVAGFYDFSVGICDLTMGTMKAFPELGYICTKNYNHSYFRSEDRLHFLRKSEMVIGIIDTIASDLVEHAQLDAAEAKRFAGMMIQRRIAFLTGPAAFKRKGFERTRSFRDEVLQENLRIFQDLFTEGTVARDRYGDRLAYILQVLKKNAASSDNTGEHGMYQNLSAGKSN
jgi:glycosyltransferase domain-containing protein